MSSTFPLDPPHALAVGANLLQTHRLLLYSGRMTGRWFNVTTTRVPGPGSGGSREPVTVTEPQKDIVGVGTVTLKLSPDPHIDWFFAHNGLVPLDQWPVLIPPSSLSNDFATRIGPAGLPHTPRDRTALAGTRRIEDPVQIGDVDGLLGEIRFYLVNFQAWFLAEDITRVSGTDKGAGMRLGVDDWRIAIERRREFTQAMSHMEDNRGYAITHNCRLWREHDTVVEKWHVSAVDPGRYQRHPVAKPLTRPPSSSPGRQEGRRLRAGGAGRCRAGRARGPAVGWNARAPPWTLGVAGATWAAVCLGLLLYDSRSSCRRPPQGTPDGPRRTASPRRPADRASTHPHPFEESLFCQPPILAHFRPTCPASRAA